MRCCRNRDRLSGISARPQSTIGSTAPWLATTQLHSGNACLPLRRSILQMGLMRKAAESSIHPRRTRERCGDCLGRRPGRPAMLVSSCSAPVSMCVTASKSWLDVARDQSVDRSRSSTLAALGDAPYQHSPSHLNETGIRENRSSPRQQAPSTTGPSPTMSRSDQLPVPGERWQPA